MGSVVISGATSGAVTLAVPAEAGTRTLTLPALTGSVLTNATAGVVLQVIQAVKVDAYSATVATWTDVTDVTVNITPSSTSSKVFVMCNFSVGSDGTDNTDFMARLVRGSTAIALGNDGGTDPLTLSPLTGVVSGYNTQPQSIAFLDSPSSTDATTYKLQMRNWSSTSHRYYVGQRGLNASFILPSHITVMEVAG